MKKLKPDEMNELEQINNTYIINQGQVKSQIGMYIRQRNLAIAIAIAICVLSFVGFIMAMKISGEAKRVDKVVYRENGSEYEV